VQNELELLRTFRHPRILLFLGSFELESEIYLVTEFCRNGNLFNFIRAYQDKMTLLQQLKFASDICSGMTYLHSVKHLCHRDLRTRNLLVTEALDIKIADFGLAARVAGFDSQSFVPQQLYVPIVPPEVFLGAPFGPLADIFSFGLVLNEMYSKVEAWPNYSAQDIKLLVLSAARPIITPHCPLCYRALIESCWHQDPAKRPSSFEEIQTCLDEIRGALFTEHNIRITSDMSLAETVPGSCGDTQPIADNASETDWESTGYQSEEQLLKLQVPTNPSPHTGDFQLRVNQQQ